MDSVGICDQQLGLLVAHTEHTSIQISREFAVHSDRLVIALGRTYQKLSFGPCIPRTTAEGRGDVVRPGGMTLKYWIDYY